MINVRLTAGLRLLRKVVSPGAPFHTADTRAWVSDVTAYATKGTPTESGAFKPDLLLSVPVVESGGPVDQILPDIDGE